MRLFGRRQGGAEPPASEVGKILERLHTLESAMRQLETEQITLHDQCRRWMRRAVAVERAAVSHPAPTSDGIPPGGMEPSRGTASPRPLWGARARIAARRAARVPETSPTTSEEEPTDGVHS